MSHYTSLFPLHLGKSFFNPFTQSPIPSQNCPFALARWFSWLEHCPVHQHSCRFDAQSWCILEASHRCFSLSLFLKTSKTYPQVCFKKNRPWLVWLSGLGVNPQTERSPAPTPGQGTCLDCRPGPRFRVCLRGNGSTFLLHIIFLSLFLPLLSS